MSTQYLESHQVGKPAYVTKMVINKDVKGLLACGFSMKSIKQWIAQSTKQNGEFK